MIKSILPNPRQVNMQASQIQPNEKFSLWLCPDGSAFAQLTGVIEKLAEDLSSQVFAPHITICSGFSGDSNQFKKLLHDLAQNFLPMIISPQDFSHHDNFFQSLFIRLELSPKLQDLHDNASAVLGSKPKEDFFPHISLAYQDPALFDARRVCDTLDPQLLEVMSFSRLVLMETSGEIADWAILREYEADVR